MIEGDLPPCEADQLLTLVPIQTDKHTSKKNPSQSGGYHSKSAAGPSREKRRSNSSDDEFSFELAAALSASMTTHTKVKDQEEFDITMASALSESMRGEYIPYSIKFSRLKIFTDFVGRSMAEKIFFYKISSS